MGRSGTTFGGRALGAGLATVVLAASAVVGLPTSVARASTNNNFFALGSDLTGGASAVYGPNEPIYFSGIFNFNLLCKEKNGVPDFVWSATDVYVVDTQTEPAAGADLSQTGNGTPRTIVTPGVALDEILDITGPGGALGEGTYSVVYDTCQDGKYDPTEDLFIPNAFSVEFPAVVPPPSPFIALMKGAAKVAAKVWGKLSDRVAAMRDVAFADLQRACGLGDAFACAEIGIFNKDKTSVLADPITRAKALTENIGNSFSSLAADPPRADFAQPTGAVLSGAVDSSPGGSHLEGALSAANVALQREQALLQAFLGSIERYQGAEEAGDGASALARAQESASLARAIIVSEADVAHRMQAVPTAIVADDPNFVGDVQAIATRLDNLRQNGFSPTEIQSFRNQGNTPLQIANLRDQMVANLTASLQSLNNANLNQGGIAPDMNAPNDALPASQAAFTAAATGFDDAAAQIRASSVSTSAKVPTASISAPATAVAGVPVQLGVTVTSSSPTVVDWDLNGDGVYTDASGTAPSVAFPSGGEHFVAARISGTGVAPFILHALIDVTDPNQPPTLGSTTPAATGLTATVGDTGAFSVAPSDAEGDPVSVSWSYDGVAAGTGASLSHTYTAGDLGSHVVTATATDGHVGHTVTRSWQVTVSGPDLDGDGWANTPVADCNDGDSTIHPGATEVLLNGKDDDCDPATLDAPPSAAGGAVTGGKVAAWGNYFGVGPTFGPTYVSGIDNAVQVQMDLEDGFALRADGTVTAFGPFGSVTRGCGSTSCPAGLSDVVGVGGIGKLTGVTRLDFDATAARMGALRQDGSVVMWGAQGGRLGDGSTGGALALSPVQVLRADTHQPLTGLTQVEVASFQSWGITTAGDAWVWGHSGGGGCLGPTRSQQVFDLAEPAPELGKVAQISETYANSALIRRPDGSVAICGPTDPISPATFLPRTVPGFGPNGALGRAVDVYSGFGGLWVVNDRGQLYGWGGGDSSLTVFGIPPAHTIVPPFSDPNGQFVTNPTLVPLPAGAPAVSISGDLTTTLLRADGSVLVWGMNTFNSTGLGGTPNVAITATPIDVLGLAINTDASVWSGAAVVLPKSSLAAGYVPPQTWIGLSAGPETGAVSGPEGSSVAVPLRLTAAASTDTTVSWSFNGVTGTTVIPAGSTTGSATVTLPHDGINGPSIDTVFTATSVTNGVRIDNPSTTVTATDIDPAPSASVAPVTVAEGNTNLTDIAVTVSLSAPSGFDTVAHLQTADGSAVAGVDYRSMSQDVPFAAGETSKVVHLTGIGNTVPQPNRQFSVQVAGTANLSPTSSSATVTITDDDPVALITTGSSVAAGGVASVAISAPAQPAGESLTVNWSAASGSALSGTDFTPSSGTVTLTGSTPVTVPVPTSPGAAAGAGPTVKQVQFTVTGTVVNPARAVLPASPAIVTITGLSGAADTVPPVVTGSPDRAPNANGWYSAPVTITWSAVDDVDGILPAPAPTTISTESDGTGPATLAAPVCDATGNCATGSFGPIKLDLTKPTISAAAGGAPNAAGWYNNPVTVSFGCADALSGVAVCPNPVDLSDGANQSASGSASDLADNTASAGVAGINIDTTAPSISGTPTTSPNAAGWYRSSVGIHWTCSDAGSGLLGACPADSTVTGEGAGLTASASVSDIAGNTTLATSSPVDIDRTPPVTAVTAPAGFGGASVALVLVPTDGLSGVDHTEWQLDNGVPQTGTTITVTGPGKHTLTFHSVDVAGNSEATVTTSVVIDNGAPTITPVVNPVPNGAGWNNTPVTVSWLCSDPNGVASCSGPTTVSTEGKDQLVQGSTADMLGNVANGQQLVSVDLTAPTATPTLSATPNGAGWFHTNVDISWVCGDALSGVTSCPATTTLTQATPGPVTAAATDNAGNTRQVTVPAVKIDTTPPVVSIAGVVDGANYAPGSVPAATCTASDALSGLAAACVVTTTGPTAGVGAFTVTATAVDVAGNTATVKATYQVATGVCAATESPKERHDDDCGDDHGRPGHHRGTWDDFGGDFHGKAPSGWTRESCTAVVRVSFHLLADDALAYGPAEQPRWLTPVKLGSATRPLSIGDAPAVDSGATFTNDGTNWTYQWKPATSQAGYYWRIGVRLASGEVHTTVVWVGN